MIRWKTDQLLTLGMALTNDRRTMERRVRGVFARKRSAKGIVALSLMLALALGFGAFTTACQPGQPIGSATNEQLASSGNALVSNGNGSVSGGNANIPDSDSIKGFTITKEDAMHRLSQELENARKMVVPRIEGIEFTERGTWETVTSPDKAEQRSAEERFLEYANAIFQKSFTSTDLITTYYVDKSGFRSDVWRFDSKDGVLSGALDAETLAFLSADCLNEPADALHASLTNGTGDKLDVDSATVKIAKILGGEPWALDFRSGYSQVNATNGWMVKRVAFFQLGDGRYCAISMFGDANLTPVTVCAYPDEDCGDENVFWRADLVWAESAGSMLHPQDFRIGEPSEGDMTKEEAIAFFDRLIETAGYQQLSENEESQEPTTIFMEDHSGVRENYWQIERNGISLLLTSKTGRMLSLTADGRLGTALGLEAIPYEQMGEQEYVDATQKLFTELFGKQAVKTVMTNAVYDFHYCTIDPFMADGTQYEIMYQDGMIVEVTSFYKIDPNTWPSVPEWLQEWTKVDQTTGEITIQGFENGTWKMVPNWLADWVYVNNETGELFAKEW